MPRLHGACNHQQRRRGRREIRSCFVPVTLSPVPENSKLSSPHESGFVHNSAPRPRPWLGLVPCPRRQDLINPQSGEGPAKDVSTGTLASRPLLPQSQAPLCAQTGTRAADGGHHGAAGPLSTQQEQGLGEKERGLGEKGHGLRPQTCRALQTRVQVQINAPGPRIGLQTSNPPRGQRHSLQEAQARTAGRTHVADPVHLAHPFTVTGTCLNGLSLGQPCSVHSESACSVWAQKEASGQGVLSAREARR